MSDRSQSIRDLGRSTSQFTLVLTIGLVVMVIFVFPAPLLGDGHTDRSPCRSPWSAPSA